MGQLIRLLDLQNGTNGLPAFWYFDDAVYTDHMGKTGYRFKYPSNRYPYLVSIHRDDIDTKYVDIRKWIEQSADGIVIHSNLDKSYRVWWSDNPTKRNWEHTSEIRNWWELFYFENAESSLAFTLAFGDIVNPITEDHPTKHYGERYVR